MKTTLKPLLLLMLVVASCKTPESKVAPPETTFVQTPFSGKEYQSDHDYYRAVASGTAASENIAAERALDNARAQIVAEIEIDVERSSTDFATEEEVQNKLFNSSEYTRQVITLAKGTLKDVRKVGQTTGKMEDGRYKVYCVAELDREKLYDQLKDIPQKDLDRVRTKKEEHDQIINRLRKN